MYLIDIGNTTATIYNNGVVWSESIEKFKKFNVRETVYFINVNDSLKEHLAQKKNYVDLEPYFELDTIYKGLGVDRVATCCAVESGIIIDAGSAITVDIISSNSHLGGFIMPGLNSALNAFKGISPKLDVLLMTNIDLNALPEDTANAVSYGIIKPIILMIKEHCKDKKIYFTGGDGAFLSRFFPQSIYSKTLVFNGITKTMKKHNLL